ncbi:hypothetical protein DITRI_Ditri08aG0146000 [Diplodiscus trichospermus]
MACQTFHHTRSNSFPLPSRRNPLVSHIVEHLNRLKASDATSASSSSTSISDKLNGLQDLYNCVDMLLQLPSAQQVHRKFNQFCVGELELVNEVRKYFTSRKVVQKTIHKALRNLKGQETKVRVFSSSDDHEIKAMVNLLKGLEAVTCSMFECLLSLISMPMQQSKPSSWLLVSKLLSHKRIACKQARRRDINEFRNVDAGLRSIVSRKMSKFENMMNVEMQKQLKQLELCIQDLED